VTWGGFFYKEIIRYVSDSTVQEHQGRVDGARLQDILGGDTGTAQIADGFFLLAQVGVDR